MHEKVGFSLMRPFDAGLGLRLPAYLAERSMSALLLLPLTHRLCVLQSRDCRAPSTHQVIDTFS